jgi:hypothetical protein
MQTLIFAQFLSACSVVLTVSGLSGTKETAQSQVLIGMGLLAGSTVFLLTLLWGTCVVVGKCDVGPNGLSIDSTDTKGFSLTGKFSCIYDNVIVVWRISDDWKFCN